MRHIKGHPLASLVSFQLFNVHHSVVLMVQRLMRSDITEGKVVLGVKALLGL